MEQRFGEQPKQDEQQEPATDGTTPEGEVGAPPEGEDLQVMEEKVAAAELRAEEANSDRLAVESERDEAVAAKEQAEKDRDTAVEEKAEADMLYEEAEANLKTAEAQRDEAIEAEEHAEKNRDATEKLLEEAEAAPEEQTPEEAAAEAAGEPEPKTETTPAPSVNLTEEGKAGLSSIGDREASEGQGTSSWSTNPVIAELLKAELIKWTQNENTDEKRPGVVRLTDKGQVLYSAQIPKG